MCSASPKAGPSRKPPSFSPTFFGTNPDFLRLSPHETVDRWLAGYRSARRREQSGLLLAAKLRGSGESAGCPAGSPRARAGISRRTAPGDARLARFRPPTARPHSPADPGRHARRPARLALHLLCLLYTSDAADDLLC